MHFKYVNLRCHAYIYSILPYVIIIYFIDFQKYWWVGDQKLSILLEWPNSTHVTQYCAVIGHTLYRALQQTAVKEVTRLLPSLVERGVATRD